MVKCLQFLSTDGLLFLKANSLVYQGKFAFNFWVNYKASIIDILIMLALNNINYKASIIDILIILALKYVQSWYSFFACILNRLSLFTKFLPIESVETCNCTVYVIPL